MDRCVACGTQLPAECGSMVCEQCMKKAETSPVQIATLVQPLLPNTELSFGADDGSYDFLVNYRRAKPLNRFQIWMYKICFGIRARNI